MPKIKSIKRRGETKVITNSLLALVTRAAKHPWLAILLLILSSPVVAALDFLTPQQVPTDAFFVFPIGLGVLAFGLRGGVVVATTSILLFYISNYLIIRIGDENLIPSLVLNLLIFYCCAFGIYFYVQNLRKLSQVQHNLQLRLDDLESLRQKSEELHKQSLNLVVIKERNRLAREVHDVLAQGFLTIVVQVEAAWLNWEDREAAAERLAKIDELARYNLQEARRSVTNLRPLPLDSASLIEALNQKVEELAREYALIFKFETSGEPRKLPLETESTLYRIAQEALNNVVHHSNAKNIQLTLDFDEEEVCLTVQDDGQGFESGQRKENNGLNRKTYGLETMQERASLVGGIFTIQSKIGEGCRVRVLVPYNTLDSLENRSEDNSYLTLPGYYLNLENQNEAELR